MGVNESGNLTVAGVDMVALAKEYGTPLYVMDEDMIRSVCRKFRDSIVRYYQGNGLVCYASKAFSCKEIYRIMKSEEIGIDAVSIGELYTAFSVDFPAEHICFHGNNKTEEELRYAVEKNVGRIIVDNLTELESLNRIAAEMNKKPGVMFRIKPGIDAHTHDFIRTGQIDSKFGFALETGEAMAAVKEALKLEHLELKGLHCHIGSQIFDIDPFEAAAEVMMKFMAQIKADTGLEIRELNLGGGFGIKYTQADQPSDYDCYMERVSGVVKKLAEKLNLPVPFIYIEPGRSIVAQCGTLISKVLYVKEGETKKFAILDAGFTELIRPAMYDAYHRIENISSDEAVETYDVVGPICESSDVFGKDVELNKAHRGDLIALRSAGAYGEVMASQYNCRHLPKAYYSDTIK